MDEDHLSRERVQGFFRSELSRREMHEVVRHLIRRCARFPVSMDCYDAAFRRLLGAAGEVQAEWTRERLRLSALPAELLLAD